MDKNKETKKIWSQGQELICLANMFEKKLDKPSIRESRMNSSFDVLWMYYKLGTCEWLAEHSLNGVKFKLNI